MKVRKITLNDLIEGWIIKIYSQSPDIEIDNNISIQDYFKLVSKNYYKKIVDQGVYLLMFTNGYRYKRYSTNILIKSLKTRQYTFVYDELRCSEGIVFAQSEEIDIPDEFILEQFKDQICLMKIQVARGFSGYDLESKKKILMYLWIANKLGILDD